MPESAVPSSLSWSWLITDIHGEYACALLIESGLLSSWGPLGLALLLLVMWACISTAVPVLSWARTLWTDSSMEMFGKYKSSRPWDGMGTGPNFSGTAKLPESECSWLDQAGTNAVYSELVTLQLDIVNPDVPGRQCPRIVTRWGLSCRHRVRGGSLPSWSRTWIGPAARYLWFRYQLWH